MKVENLQDALKLAGLLSNAGSLTPLYRSVEIGPETIRACSENGNIVAGVETGLDEICLLDTKQFQAVIKQQHGEITFSKVGDRLRWDTPAKGGFLDLVSTVTEEILGLLALVTFGSMDKHVVLACALETPRKISTPEAFYLERRHHERLVLRRAVSNVFLCIACFLGQR